MYYPLDINMELQNMTKSDEKAPALDLIWGAEEIGEAIGPLASRDLSHAG